ncbi:MAG: hypothetical protein WC959_09980 [Kiritimatiellales bacterium]
MFAIFIQGHYSARLYDLKNDTDEMNDPAGLLEYAEVLKSL